MQLEGPVHRPTMSSCKRRLSLERECDKRRKVCEGQEVRSVPSGVRSRGSQTMSLAIGRLPVSSRSLPVPWGVQRSSSVSASTQTLSRDRPSSIDDLCDLDVELLEDDVFLAEDTAPEVYGSDEAMNAILDTLLYMTQRGVHEPLTPLCNALISPIKDEDDGEDQQQEPDSGVEGVVFTQPLGGRRHVATNTLHVPTRVINPRTPRRKYWRKGSRHWRSSLTTNNSSTQTD